MKKIDFDLGDTIVISKFCFTNPQGGTGLSDGKFDEVYKKPARVIITKVWYDYECGIRGWAEPVEDDTELKEYLKRNAAPETITHTFPVWDEEANDLVEKQTIIPANTVFWSEFDVII